MSNLDRIIADAAAEMDRRIGYLLNRAMKDAARAILRGEPTLNVRERPKRIAQRYIRRLSYLRRTRD